MAPYLRTPVPLLLASLPLACVAPWADLDCVSAGCPDTSTTSEPSDTTVGTLTLPTTTADTLSSSTATTGPGLDLGDGTTTEPLPPPAIVGHVLNPDPLTQLGSIDVAIVAAHASGVRMRVDDEDSEIDLVGGPDEFTGAIPFYTGLSSGPHQATLVAWRDDLESQTAVVPFEVALPEAGSYYFWEATDMLNGKGNVATVAALPSGTGEEASVIEWGTFYENNQARCYLRRRDANGGWVSSDLVEVLPDKVCTALDLEVAPDGTLHLLAARLVNNEPEWWLGTVESWETAATPKHVNSGMAGEEARALALGPDKLVVCGTRPVNTPAPDKLDAAVWVVGKQPRVFDLEFGEFFPHRFDENVQDCDFDGETLVVVGDARGKYTDAPMALNLHRHLQLRVNLQADAITPYVGAELGTDTQGSANAVAIDAQGRVVTVGHSCGDDCEPSATLWIHAPDGMLEWYAPLGADLMPPRAVAITPAGHAIVAGSLKVGQGTNFWIGAYVLDEQYAPAWTFVHDGMGGLELARSVSVGPMGHIYGGGLASGFPAVVYLNP